MLEDPTDPTDSASSSRPARFWLVGAGVGMLLLGAVFLSGGIAHLGDSPAPHHLVADHLPATIAGTPTAPTTNPVEVPLPPSPTPAAPSPSARPRATHRPATSRLLTSGSVTAATTRAAARLKSPPKKTTKKPLPKKSSPPVVLPADAAPGFTVLRSLATGRCLDSDQKGALYTLPCNGGQYQNWTAIPVGGTATRIVQLKDVETGFCLSGNEAVGLFTEPCSGSDDHQQWRWSGTSGASVYTHRSNGRCLDGNATGSTYSHQCGTSYQIWQQG